MVRFAIVFVLLAAAPFASAQEQAWLEQARTALARGDFVAARAAAKQALTQRPDSAEAEVIAGLADTAEGQLPSAGRHFARAVSLEPANYRAHTYLGSTYLRQQRLAEARTAFSRVLQLNPGNAVAQYNLGVIAVLEGNPAAAVPFFSAVLQANPGDAAALIALLECQLDLKQSPAARESARKLDRLLAAESPALLQVGVTLAAHGEYGTALPLLRRFAAANPASSDGVYNLALVLLHTGSLEEAETLVKRLLSQAPKAESYNLLGTVLEKRGEQKEALRMFAEAARLAPNNENFRIDHGSSLVDAGLTEDAITAFSQGVEDLPKSVRLRLGLGSALYLSGKYEAAARTMLETVRDAPRFAPAYDLLGKIFESAPESQREIMAAFRAYLEGGANDAAAHCHYAVMLYARVQSGGLDRIVTAKKHLRRALELNPKLAQAHVQLGIIAQSESNLPAALASYEQAVALDPSYAIARYRLGSVYQKLGEHAKAQIELDAFRALKQKEKNQEREAVMRSVSAAK